MNALIEEKLDMLADLCRNYSVNRLELFGSGATDSFDLNTSDLDFLVAFKPATPVVHAERYLGLLAAVQDLFGRNIDLVEIGAIRNPYFME
ncbi:nucleotidyltransferase family protein, partial [Candidatus Hydrogenedentota bacterium]